MFFILSKILAFIITPLLWIVTLLLFTFFSKDERKKRRFLLTAICIILLFSNGFIFNTAMNLWEVPATPYSELGTYEAGIVLGGMSVNDETLGRPQFFRGVDRLIQAIDLYKRGVIKKIVFTSGSGRVLHPEMKEALYLKDYILKMGVNENDLLIESESNNTHENAAFTKVLLQKEKLNGKFLLITSAFHMKRSLGCFNKEGIIVQPYSTDRYSGPVKFEFDHFFIPDISALSGWTGLIHEIVGYITYKIKGYS
jgi:uncharacterized SAM-binding protein YcdF (DUF218 family)